MSISVRMKTLKSGKSSVQSVNIRSDRYFQKQFHVPSRSVNSNSLNLKCGNPNPFTMNKTLPIIFYLHFVLSDSFQKIQMSLYFGNLPFLKKKPIHNFRLASVQRLYSGIIYMKLQFVLLIYQLEIFF